MNTTMKTPMAARRLSVSYHRLMGLLRANKITPPAKDSSGDYLWAEADLTAAREALARSRRKIPPK